ncbi:MAG: isoprenyl transferase [Bacteroidota bacterium]|jgi:undecaprenyl diphosphate synthase|nr:isoprenyl transferase [Bacteroidota bacterium]MEC8679169.1 isoprenyl transferase [Bacteroidota bacterium]GIS31487.1 MAG: isoprenyl transferase [Flammeovirgaceae bacterium]|tara:strand:- start:774 stop:1475 length:702 start_codon:yes stop_codon:yes gene_type:complete
MNKEEIPQHIAIIMDGNGRWAKIRNENRIQGHIKAKKSVRESIEFCVEKKIKYLTLFAFSTENWKRPKLEVQALMNLLNNVISDELNTLKNQNIKLKVIGDLSPLPKKTKESLELAINETSKNKGLCLILAINYSGKWDIFNATKKILETKQKLDLANFNEKVFEKNLSTYNIPDPELIIRTSGEERISNFYLWQAAYSELYFTDILWPDFNKNELNNAIFEFKNRNRRFGKL